MRKIVYVRLDDETSSALELLCRNLGWNESQVIREGILWLATVLLKRRKRRVVGMGKFASCTSNLGSNKQHLRGLGK